MLWFLLSEATFTLVGQHFNDPRWRRFMSEREVLKSTPETYAAANGDEALDEVLEFYTSLFHDAIAHMAHNWRAYARDQRKNVRATRKTWPHLMAALSTGPHFNDYRPVTVRPGIHVSRCILQALENEPTDAARMTIMTLAVGRVLSGSD